MRQFGSDRCWVAGFEGKAVTASEGVRSAAIASHVAAVAKGGRADAPNCSRALKPVSAPARAPIVTAVARFVVALGLTPHRAAL